MVQTVNAATPYVSSRVEWLNIAYELQVDQGKREVLLCGMAMLLEELSLKSQSIFHNVIISWGNN